MPLKCKIYLAICHKLQPQSALIFEIQIQENTLQIYIVSFFNFSSVKKTQKREITIEITNPLEYTAGIPVSRF